jgi:hypothetical protein
MINMGPYGKNEEFFFSQKPKFDQAQIVHEISFDSPLQKLFEFPNEMKII